MLLLLVPPLAALVIRCLAATLRFEVIAEPGATPIVTGTTGVCCFWHQCLLTCTCFFSGRFEASVLISQSFDGELIARTAGRLGFQAARGSSSRGGFAGLRDLTTALKSDVPAVFPADGPRGPRYRLKPGAIKLAQLTQLPLGLVHAFPERHWQLNSWDGFLIPTPFSRVVICWSRLFHIEREMTPAAFEDTRIEIEAALESVRLMAETHFARKLSS
jgi:lysophospholipid acyltransferase (LPLAT)-like uncharacterized protein